MVDVIAIGRGLLADPHWADKLRFKDARDIRPCVGCYDGCFEAYSKLRNISCALNPASGRERAYRLEPVLNPLNVMVIGGGVGGMEAARVAALRGHRVSLHEKTRHWAAWSGRLRCLNSRKTCGVFWPGMRERSKRPGSR